MCGISGTTRADDGTALTAMNRAMVHRGPDDEGSYVDPQFKVGLAVRRLSIIDVPGGHQPIANEDQTIWAILNGEIYNHPALRERLRARGHRFQTRGDTEVLVHAYEEFGQDFVHALEGMFALAIWDRHCRRLVLARDRFGEKPLFYTVRHGALTFASELTALAAGTGGVGDVSAQSVDTFFLLGYVPGPRTIVEEAKVLQPGHLLSWDQHTGSLAIQRYWVPSPMPRRVTVPMRELVEETHQLLDSSVKSRMISDVPLGVFLSGGVDSTLVAALATRNSTEAIKTFTVGYDVGAVNEFEPARRVASAIGADHHEFMLTHADASVRAPQVLAALDQPIADQALIASQALAESARTEVTVAIGGEGADELFGGYPRYRWLARSLRLQQLVPATVVALGSGVMQRFSATGKARRFGDVISRNSVRMRHFEWVSDHRRATRHWLYGSRLKPLLTGSDPFPEVPDLVAGLDGQVADIMRIDQMTWLPDDVLAKADRSSMLVSLEVRTPYLDRRLAEFAFSVPSFVHCNPHGKRLLRAVLAELLPEAAARPKVGFRVPAAEWLRGGLAKTVSQQLENGCIYNEGWFDRAAAHRMAREHHQGARDWSGLLWPMLAFGLWLDRFRGRS